MDTQTKDAVRIFSEFVNHAHSALRLPQYQIKNLFPGNPVCLMNYQENKEISKIIEIRFDEKEITLTCSFDKDGICNSSFLFLDSLENIDEFVNYLHENFDYDFRNRSWILTKGYIRINSMRNDVAFMCFS